ncbi:hypothetical protein MBLNU457_2075t1 [Dothideomycetes sp. NU457]
MATTQTGLSLLRPLGGRSLHLRILPRPQNISQSRAILDQLKQYGQIEYYKNLKYERLPSPSSAIVIFKTRESAEALLAKSSINLTVSVPRRNNHIDLEIHTPPHLEYEAPVQEHQFQIQINTSTYAHRDHINTGAYHAGFAIDTKSARQEDLAQRVPLVGLSDINLRRKEKPWRVMAWQRAREFKGRKPLKALYELGLKEEREREVREAREAREKVREEREREVVEAKWNGGDQREEGEANKTLLNDGGVMGQSYKVVVAQDQHESMQEVPQPVAEGPQVRENSISSSRMNHENEDNTASEAASKEQERVKKEAVGSG